MTTNTGYQGMTPDQARAVLKSHFVEYSGDKYKEGWDELWKKGDFLPWDRFAPSPALTDTLSNAQNLVGTCMLTQEDGTKRRKRALVPGCGRGVDVLLLQSFGYDALGVEYSQGAVDACEQYAKEKGGDEMYQAKDEKIGLGNRKYVQGDFYTDAWLEKAGLPKDTTFELIYDYTVGTNLFLRLPHSSSQQFECHANYL